MNSYQLISKLRKVRADTYLSPASQLLYHELVAICNELKWKEVFRKKGSDLCCVLNMSEKTLIKSRNELSDAGLIYFKSSRDKRIGCYYSFTTVISSVYFTGESTDDSTDESTDDNMETDVVSTVTSTVVSPVKCLDDNVASSVLSPVKCTDDMQITPIIDNINIKQEESLAHTHEIPPPVKTKSSRKKEGDNKPLVFPFTSDKFMSTWNKLLNTPKWKKKLNLALQISLNKLAKYDEEFSIEQMERAIESNWTGVVFPGTDEKYQEWLNLRNGNNRKLSKADKARLLLNEYQSIATGEKQSPTDAEILKF